MTATFVLREDVDLGLEFGVRCDRARLAADLATLNFFTLGSTKKYPDVLACLTFVEQFAEHLDTGDGGLEGNSWSDTNDFDFFVDLDDSTFNTTGNNCSTAGDGEDVFDWHQEGLVNLTLWCWNVGVNSVHEIHDRLSPLLVTLKCWESSNAHYGDVIAGEFVLAEQFTNFHFNELNEFLIVDHVALVERNDNGGHAYLASKENVLLGLWHWAVGCSNHEDCAVHLRCTCDHVLDVVSVTWAVDVGVVPAFCLVLNVCDRDRDTALTFFRGLVDHVERREGVHVWVTIVQHLCDSSSQRGLAMVNVTNGPDVDVRLIPFKLGLRHLRTPSVRAVRQNADRLSVLFLLLYFY